MVLLVRYGNLEFQVWPPRSNLTSEVKVEIAVQFRIVIGAYIQNFVKIGLLEVKLLRFKVKGPVTL